MRINSSEFLVRVKTDNKHKYAQDRLLQKMLFQRRWGKTAQIKKKSRDSTLNLQAAQQVLLVLELTLDWE